MAALIRMLDPLGVSAPAARTAISRMVAQGWLVADQTRNGPGYALTDRARIRLDEAAARIYRTGATGWDGRWQVRVLGSISDRVRRERVRSQLRFLGMAPISDSTWISPHQSGEVDRLLVDEGVQAISFSATDAAPGSLLLAAFDIETLGAAYLDWLSEAGALVAPDGHLNDEQAFVVRSELLHSWRKFLFTDPGLPAVLLPADWPGARAAAFFDEHADRLRPAATRFIDQCLTREGATP